MLTIPLLHIYAAASSNGNHPVSRKQNDPNMFSNDQKINNKDGKRTKESNVLKLRNLIIKAHFQIYNFYLTLHILLT